MSSRYIFCIILGLGWNSLSHAQNGLSDLERELLLGDGSSLNQSYSESPAQTHESPKIEEIKVDKDELEEIEQAIAGPDRIPLEQVFVVQKRYVTKEDKHEFTPISFGIQPADSFRRQFQWGFSWTYHFTESFALEGLHVAFIKNFNTGLVDDLNKIEGFGLDYRITPMTILGSTMVWTPFKSKAATRANVYHFESYFNLGGGVGLTEVSKSSVVILGLGFRAFLNRSSLIKVELRDYMSFGENSSRNRVSLIVGAGILL